MTSFADPLTDKQVDLLLWEITKHFLKPWDILSEEDLSLTWDQVFADGGERQVQLRKKINERRFSKASRDVFRRVFAGTLDRMARTRDTASFLLTLRVLLLALADFSARSFAQEPRLRREALEAFWWLMGHPVCHDDPDPEADHLEDVLDMFGMDWCEVVDIHAKGEYPVGLSPQFCCDVLGLDLPTLRRVALMYPGRR